MHDPHVRGQVLHFFANHELLALELMALALLKFTTAPEGFRQGLVRTMTEEQNHLKLYLKRMTELGVNFGDIPVNDFFWHALQTMQDPLDYVAGMSLTFEQANLDFSDHYRKLFRTLGDESTSTLLDVVYQEEIGHVKYGVTWFDRLRPKESTRFCEYRDLLKLPLTPGRARGTTVDRDARLKAGLDQDFIDQVTIYPDHRGRKPSVFYFNFDCEAELAAGPRYQPIDFHAALNRDLSLLPLCFASEGDTIITERKPSDQCLLELASWNFPLVNFSSNLRQVLAETKPIGEFVCWGDAPSIRAEVPIRFLPWLNNEGATLPSSLHSKHSIIAHRKALRLAHPKLMNYPNDWDGILATSLGEIETYAEHILQNYDLGIVMKSVFSTAGRGKERANGKNISKHARLWCEAQLDQFGHLVVEPWFDRVVDLSCQFLPRATKEPFYTSRFLTSKQGQYRAHVIRRPSDFLTSKQEKILANTMGHESRALEVAAGFVKMCLGQEFGYRGPFGIDAFIFRDRMGHNYLQPLCEINARLTMGAVSARLLRWVSRQVPSLFAILTRRDFERAGCSHFSEFRERCDLTYAREQDSAGRFTRGFLWLGEVDKAEVCLPVVAVGAEACLFLSNTLD